ncbi:MAG: DotH/IcmK family type IV secretion protein [Pseudomonadota bacterium]
MEKGIIKNIAFGIVLFVLCSQIAIAQDAISETDAMAPATTTTTTTVIRHAYSPTDRQGFDFSRNAPAVQSKPMTYEESRDAILDSAPVMSTSADANTAFNALLQQNMPLTPQQVIKLRQLLDVSQRAAATPPTVPPKPVSTTIIMNLAPGTTPPAIRLSKGYVTSLVFVDSTGAPWPIAGYYIGDPKATNIQWDSKSNVLLMQANAPYSNGDIVVRLVGLMTPITLELVSGQRVVDFRTDVHVSGLGPNSKDIPMDNGLPNSANQLLLSVLDGIAPPGSKLLTVKGGECQAWLMGDKMFLRTRFTLLSPGWMGKMVSPDGMYAYEVQRSSSVLVSLYGEPVELKIEGF